MYSICLRYMNSHNDAQDAMQEGFIKVFNKISSYSFTGSFEGWMKKIFIHTSIELIRKKKYHQNIENINDSELSRTAKIEVGFLDAKKLIDVASKSGADYVKFQTFDVDQLILKDTKTAGYQKRNLKNNISQYQMLKKYQIRLI